MRTHRNVEIRRCSRLFRVELHGRMTPMEDGFVASPMREIRPCGLMWRGWRRSDGNLQTGTKLETANTAKGRPVHRRAGPRPDWVPAGRFRKIPGLDRNANPVLTSLA
jgi:hypothetical protein